MKKFAMIAVVLLAVGLAAYPVGAETRAAIAAVLGSPEVDGPVMVVGTVSPVEGAGNGFILTDDSGSINVCAGPPWFQSITLAAGETVTVTGQADLDGPRNQACQARSQACQGGSQACQARSQSCRTEGPCLEAFTIVRGDGSTIIVRDGPGRPPWAGVRGRGEGRPPSDAADDADDAVNETD